MLETSLGLAYKATSGPLQGCFGPFSGPPISKKRLKEVLSKIICSNQTAYVKDRFIGEGGRLISDILEMTDDLHMEGILVTIDFQKAFDTVPHKRLTQQVESLDY